jgi:transposase
MPRNTRKRKKGRISSVVSLPVLRPNAAGIDLGSREIYVAVPPDRDPYPVRAFPTFTSDLLELADWLKQCGVDTVAMESTGVYWIPLFQILEARGFEVFLVNAHHVKHVPGRKTDVSDCQWIQYLHSVGLLRASFRPPQTVCQVRALMRHRDNLVQMAATHVQHMQKALDQMNLQLHHVISDLTGTTGLAILDAILDGQRDPEILARHRDPRIKATHQTIAKSLVGDYQPEHLFVLRQSLASYRAYQKQILECDQEIQALFVQFESQTDPAPLPARPKKAHKPQRNQFHFDLRAELHRILGVDLTAIPGLKDLSVHVLLSEVGPDLSAFPSEGDFASWLGLCPNPHITGGRVLSSHTRKVRHRLARALRMAAQSLDHSQSYLGQFYRRMRAKHGPAGAITIAAHKLARIIYHLLKTREPYDESVFAREEELHRRRVQARLETQAKAFGFQLVPIEASTV